MYKRCHCGQGIVFTGLNTDFNIQGTQAFESIQSRVYEARCIHIQERLLDQVRSYRTMEVFSEHKQNLARVKTTIMILRLEL